MRLPREPQLPIIGQPNYLDNLNWKLTQILREYAQQINLVSEGYVQGTTNAATAAPTTGTWNVGDFVRNKTPAELGAASSKYVITGWICTVAGTPGTWLQCRSLTGN